MRVLSSALAVLTTLAVSAQVQPTSTVSAATSSQPVDTVATTGIAIETTSSHHPIALTIDDCVAIALSDNPTIQVAEMEIERYDYSKKEVIGQLFPSINFSGTYSRMIAKQVMYLNMDLGGMGGFPGGGIGSGENGEGAVDEQILSRASDSDKKDNGIKMGLDNSYQVGFSASMPLIAPQLWKSLKLSDTQILASYENARASRINLVSQVKSAFYTLLLTQDSYRVVKESLDMAQFTADLYKKKFSLGAASEFDVLRTEVAVKNIEPDMVQAEIVMKQAKLQLKLLMGMDPAAEIVASDSLKLYENTMYENALNIDRSINNNTDLRLLDIQTEQLARVLDVQKASWWPTLALSASYNWTSSSNGSPFKNFRWNPYSVVALQLNVPLYQGGQRYSKIKQAEIQLNEMTYQRDYLTRSISMQTELAIDNINKNIRQIKSTSESVNMATRAHDIAKRSFEIGAASYLDLRDSELAITQSRLAYYQSIYNYLIACNELEHLLGNANIDKYTPARKR